MSGHTRRAATGAALTSLALTAAVLAAPAAAHADDTCTISWRGGVGTWSDTTRWSPERLPTADDRVCVVRAAGATPVTIRLATSTNVAGLTLTGAAVSVATGVFLDVPQFVARRATLTGGGTVRGAAGFLDLRDTALRGVHVAAAGTLALAGRITFTGGTTVAASGFLDPRDGVRIVDGDGDAANHIAVTGSPLYLTGSVFVGVRLGLTDVTLLAQGDVTLARPDNLDADGALRAFPRSTLQIGTGTGGSLTLPRSITAIGNRTSVYAGDVHTPDGADALRTVTAVDGALLLDRPLVTDAPVAVRGRLTDPEPLLVPSLVVRAGASLVATRVVGALTCAGSCALPGARLGRLTLLTGARLDTDATRPITVDGTVALAGTLAVSLPNGRPGPGATVVLLTGGRGVTGTFDAVTTDRPTRSVTAGYQPTFVTGTIGTIGAAA